MCGELHKERNSPRVRVQEVEGREHGDKLYGQAPRGGQRVGRSGQALTDGGEGGGATGRWRSGRLEQSGRLLRGSGCWGGPLEEEEGGQGALEAAQLQDTASPGARPPRSGPPPRPAQPGHSWPGPRTPTGRRAPPPPRPPSQTWCPGRCRA